MRRFAAALGAAVLVALVAALAFVVADRRELVQSGLHWLLRDQGIPAQFSVAAVGFRTLRLDGVRLGKDGAIAADSVTIGYLPLGLVRGRVRSVSVTGLRARLDVTDKGLKVAGLPSVPGEGGSGAPVPAIGAITLRDAQIVLHAPGGAVELRADGTYGRAGGHFALGLDGPDGGTRIAATLDATGPPGHPRLALGVKADLAANSPLWGLAGLPPPVSGPLHLDVTASGTAPRTLPALAAAPSLDGMTLDVTARLDVPGLDGLHLETTGKLAGHGEAVTGTTALAAHLSRLRGADIEAADVALSAPLAFEVRPGAATLRLGGPGSVTAARLAIGDARFEGKVYLQATSADAPLVRIADGKAVIAVTLQSAADTISIARPGAPLRLSLAGTSVSVAGDAAAGTASFRTTLSQVRPADLLPTMRLDGTARLADGAMTLAADARGAKGDLIAHLAGKAAGAGASADATLTAGPFDFAPGKLQPAALSPALGALTEVRGRAAATLHFRRAGKRLASGGTIALDGLSFRLGGIAITGADGRIALDSIEPLSTPPDQSLTAHEVSMVAVLHDLRLRFRIAPGPRLDLAAATAGFAGGEIALAPLSVGPDAMPRHLTVAVRNVKIEPLLQLLDVAGLKGTGTLNGTVPLGVSGGNVTIDRGRLAAEGKGVIQLRSDQAAKALAAGGQPAELLVRALQDFHYDSLSIELDKSAAGDATALIHLKGANPAVMNAQPFAFNINVTSNVDQLVDALMQGYRLATGMVRRAAKGATHAP